MTTERAATAPMTGRLQQLTHVAAYRDMVRELAVTDFKLKYQGSVLGYLWSLGKPLMLFAVLYFVFTRFIRVGSAVPHYPVQLLLGIVLWSYFSDATSIAIGSIVDRGDLIRKVYFPRIAIPLASSISAILTFLLNLVVVFVFIVATGVPIRGELLLFLPLVIEMYVLSLGVSLLLAALYVRFRDVLHIWAVALQLGFYASPIIYPLTIVPRSARGILALNPIAQIVEDARAALVDPSALRATDLLPFPLWLIPYALPFLLVIAGYLYFESAALNFAEEI